MDAAWHHGGRRRVIAVSDHDGQHQSVEHPGERSLRLYTPVATLKTKFGSSHHSADLLHDVPACPSYLKLREMRPYDAEHGVPHNHGQPQPFRLRKSAHRHGHRPVDLRTVWLPQPDHQNPKVAFIPVIGEALSVVISIRDSRSAKAQRSVSPSPLSVLPRISFTSWRRSRSQAAVINGMFSSTRTFISR